MNWFNSRPNYQGPDYSHVHAMSSKTQGRGKSCEKYKDWVSGHVGNPGDYKDENGNPDTADNKDLYFNLGMGLHAVMDNTSPAHTGFQKWDNRPKTINRHGFFPGTLEDLKELEKNPDIKKQTLEDMHSAFNGHINIDCPCPCDD